MHAIHSGMCNREWAIRSLIVCDGLVDIDDAHPDNLQIEPIRIPDFLDSQFLFWPSLTEMKRHPFCLRCSRTAVGKDPAFFGVTGMKILARRYPISSSLSLLSLIHSEACRSKVPG